MLRSHRAGFTMIEMLIVMMTLGVLAGVAYPALSRSMAANTVDAAASVLAADIEAGFSLAARTRRPMTYTCDAAARRCRVRDQASGVIRSERLFNETSGYGVGSMTWSPATTAIPVVLGPSGIATQAFTIRLAQGNSAKNVVVSRSGLIRVD